MPIKLLLTSLFVLQANFRRLLKIIKLIVKIFALANSFTLEIEHDHKCVRRCILPLNKSTQAYVSTNKLDAS